jgi:hypothetical protein
MRKFALVLPVAAVLAAGAVLFAGIADALAAPAAPPVTDAVVRAPLAPAAEPDPDASPTWDETHHKPGHPKPKKPKKSK